MGKELRCPNCGQNNIVGCKGAYECFDCGYLWHTNKWRNKKIIMFLCLLTAIVIGLVLAIPQTWYLLASGKITLKAGAPPPGPTVTLVPIEIGDIMLEAGSVWERYITTNLIIEGTPADKVYLKAVILAFNIPPEKLQQNIYKFYVHHCIQSNGIINCTPDFPSDFIRDKTIRWNMILSEGGWFYYGSNFFSPKEFQRGQYKEGVMLSITTWYPSEDISFEMKIYFVIESRS